MDSAQLKSLKSTLYHPFSLPIIGKCLQRKAVKALAKERSPDAVKVLTEALTRLEDEDILAIKSSVGSKDRKVAGSN